MLLKLIDIDGKSSWTSKLMILTYRCVLPEASQPLIGAEIEASTQMHRV